MDVGFNVTSSLNSIRVEGENEPGIAAKLANMIGDAGISMRGFSSAVLGTKYVAHVSVDSVEDREAVVKLLQKA